jgi:hypothetical protein
MERLLQIRFGGYFKSEAAKSGGKERREKER